MHTFHYRRIGDQGEAARALRETGSTPEGAINAAGQFLAGGTNLTDYMRLNVMRPDLLVDINDLEGEKLRQISSNGDGLWIGGLVRMAEAEDNTDIAKNYPVIHDTLKLAASRQIRNMASLGGNVLQRTRCEYFRETSWPCNKRTPGSGCAAMDGFNRQHAVLGVSDACIATYPGDFAQALVALDATVEITGPDGSRRIAFSELHRLPGDTPHIETTLMPGEIITGYRIPAGPWTRRSCYVKVRDRDSYQFALAAAAVALALDGDTVSEARIALGGVATVPWRAREAEEMLKGRTLDEDAASAAAEAAFNGARTREHNAYKVPMGKETVIRALMDAKAMEA